MRGAVHSLPIRLHGVVLNEAQRQLWVGITEAVLWLGYGLSESGCDSSQGQNSCLFSTASTPALGPTQPLISSFPAVNGHWPLISMMMLRMRGSRLLRPHTSTLCGVKLIKCRAFCLVGCYAYNLLRVNRRSYLLRAGSLLHSFFDPDDGGHVFHRNGGWLSKEYTTLHPRREKDVWHNFSTCFTLVCFSAYYLTLKMEATCYSEKSIACQQTTRPYIPEDRITTADRT
jgi:hypothetical protein